MQYVVCELFRQADEPAGILETDKAVCTESAYCEGYYASYTAACLCGSFGAEWCGAESSAGNAGAFRYFYHPNVLEYGRKLYAGVLCESASPEMSGDAVQQ